MHNFMPSFDKYMNQPSAYNKVDRICFIQYHISFMERGTRMYRDRRVILSVMSVSFLAFTGCSAGGQEKAAPKTAQTVQREPVTLSFFSGAAGTMNEEQFDKFVKEPVRKKYPHITLEFVLTGKGTTINDLVASGKIPDLMVNGPAAIFTYSDLGLTDDVTPLAKKFNFDLNRIEGSVLDFMRVYSNNNGLYSMPFMNGTPVLFYNKGIFDRFGVAYPKDFMTWDDAYEIAKKVTRTENGIEYRPMEFFAHTGYNQLGATYVDPATKKSSFNSPPWKRLIETWDKFYHISGNQFKTLTYATNETNFLKDQNVAMFISPFNNIFTGISANQQSNSSFTWDLVTMPVFSDKPKIGASNIPNHVMVTKTSKHQDDAFLVVETILSDEVQSMFSRGGIIPALSKQSIKDEFLKDIDLAKGKNVSAVFKLDRAPARIPSGEYDGAVQGLVNKFLADIHSGKKDVNTALRDAEEEANKLIEAQKAKNAK
jgi:multiple sugar transport system substrate-binding protein